MVAAASRRLLKELPTQEEMWRIIADLRLQSAYALAVLGVAHLEHGLERVLKARLIQLSKEDERRMFDGAGNGILGTFSAKIRIAYALSLLGPIAYHDLLLINDIRNVFAHSLHTIDFTHSLISQDCRKLQSYHELIRIVGGAPPDHREPIFMFSETVFAIHLGFLNQIILLAAQKPSDDYTIDGVLKRAAAIAR
jgi:hypothetical protein